MEVWIEIIVCVAASLGAGLGTGFAGMSAAAVISPMLITFLGVPAYQAIGIALASDVLASAVSAYVYGKNKNLDIRNGLLLLASVMLFTYLGSFVSSKTSDSGLGLISVFMTLVLGLRFLIDPYPQAKREVVHSSQTMKIVKTLLGGAVIGFICGFVGAGGGMMMLIVLTVVLGYELKTAVGTSVFVMAFTAFTGAVSHFVIGGVYDWFLLGLCVLLTCLFAQLASRLANKLSEVAQKRFTGGVLTALGVAMVIFQFV